MGEWENRLEGKKKIIVVLPVIVALTVGSYILLEKENGAYSYNGPTDKFEPENYHFSFEYPADWVIENSSHISIPASSSGGAWSIRCPVEDNSENFFTVASFLSYPLPFSVGKKSPETEVENYVKTRKTTLAETYRKNPNIENVKFLEGPQIIKDAHGLDYTLKYTVPTGPLDIHTRNRRIELYDGKNNVAYEIGSGRSNPVLPPQPLFKRYEPELNLIVKSFSFEK